MKDGFYIFFACVNKNSSLCRSHSGAPYVVTVTSEAPLENVFGVKDDDADENRKTIVVVADKMAEVKAGEKAKLQIEACDQASNCQTQTKEIVISGTEQVV